jgi:hypothetical protein
MNLASSLKQLSGKSTWEAKKSKQINIETAEQEWGVWDVVSKVSNLNALLGYLF